MTLSFLPIPTARADRPRSPARPSVVASWRLVVTFGVLTLTVPLAGADAQGRDKGKEREAEKGAVPREYHPPAGMCRVWIDGVPPQQQPAPTDCASAVRTKPANGRVIYGEDKARGKKVDDLPIKSLRSTDKKGPPFSLPR